MGLGVTNLPPWISTVFPGFIRDVEERERLLLAQGRHEVDFPARQRDAFS